jgi:outer membrane protein OmpA-like peptidoglycan-associated protein/outer membrane protein assembly factor BamB
MIDKDTEMNYFKIKKIIQSIVYLISAIILFFPYNISGITLVIGLNFPNEIKNKVIDEITLPEAGTQIEKWRLTGIKFGLYNSSFSAESYPILINIADSLLKNSKLNVEISSYTDNIGATSYNKTLSQKRADIIKNYLISKGVEASRLTAVGYGKNDPIADNKNSEGRAMNNRIEFIVKSESGADKEKEANQTNAAELNQINNVIQKPEIKLEAPSNSSIATAKNQLQKKDNVQIDQEVKSQNTIMSDVPSQNIYNSNDVKLKAPLKQDWSYTSDGVILNQQIVGNTCYINTLNGITAISLNDGKEIWNYSYPKSPIIPSTVTFSQKYAAFITYEYFEKEEVGKSKLYLINLETGKEKWIESFEKTWYKPTLFLNDQFVFIIGGPPDDWNKPEKYFKMGLDDAYLYSYSLEDGKEVWKSKLNDSKTELISLSTDNIFLTFDYEVEKEVPFNKLLCFDIKNGNKLWDYKPSGFLTKSSIGDVIFKENKLFTRPLQGSTGIIAALQPKDGDELWSKNTGADKLYFWNNKVYSYANTEWIFGSLSTWYCADLSKGDKIFNKTIYEHSNKGKMLSIVITNIGVVAYLIRAISNITNLFSIFIPVDDSHAPVIIPSASLLNGLLNSSVLNDRGLFGIYQAGDNYVLNISKDNGEDESKIEFMFPEGVKNAAIANGTSANNAFVTYDGKVAAINIATGKAVWIKEYSPNSTSLGLIIKDDKMYLFTLNNIFQLSSE